MRRIQKGPGAGTIVAAVAVLGISLVSPAGADTILFNPNGGAGGPGTLAVATFDEKVDNALGVGAVAAINATPIGGTSTRFEVDYQASMIALVGADGHTLAAPGTIIGGVVTNQITIIAHFFETATVTSATSVSINTNTSQAGSFMEIYSSPAPTANDLFGTGFRDGNLILKAVGNAGSPGSGSFSNTGPANAQQFDQFGANNYPGVTSVVGSGGGTALTFRVTDFASNYFITPVTSYTFLFNTSNVTPFNEADPSFMFYSLPDTGGALGAAGRPVSGSPGPSPNVTPNIGTINGLNGMDFQLQSDANSTFAAIPEPSSIVMTMTGFGVVSLATLRARRRRTTI
jgi:hypothetical protein